MGMIYKNGVPYFGGGGGGTGNVDSVNGISPDVNKNVQVDVELTQAEYDALPSSKLTDDVNYWITDGSNNPLNNNVMATGVVYDNTDSGLTATNAQDAIDENASEIADVKAGLTWTYLGQVSGIGPLIGLPTSFRELLLIARARPSANREFHATPFIIPFGEVGYYMVGGYLAPSGTYTSQGFRVTVTSTAAGITYAYSDGASAYECSLSAYYR